MYPCAGENAKGPTPVTIICADFAILPVSQRTSAPKSKGFIMKVLAVYSAEEILGGGEVSFTLSLELVSKSGWDVLAALPGTGHLSGYLQERGIPSVNLPQPSLRGNLNARYLFFPQPDWLQLCRDFRPDLIHCNAVRPALYAQAISRTLRIPTILHARKSERLRWIDPFLVMRLAAIICTSNVVRRRFPLYLGRNKLKVLYNPVDLAQFETPTPQSGELREKWLEGRFGKLVGVIGRLSPVKGQHWIVEAAPEILRSVPGTRFVLVGSEDPSFPGHEQKLHNDIRERGLRDHFVFAGFQTDMASIYHALDLVAFPTSSEGFGRVAIEAGAARRALVTSDIEVLREVISGELEDLTVPLGCVSLLAKRIILLLQDEALRAEVGERLCHHVRSHFGLETHRNELLSVYRELVSPSTG